MKHSLELVNTWQTNLSKNTSILSKIFGKEEKEVIKKWKHCLSPNGKELVIYSSTNNLLLIYSKTSQQQQVQQQQRELDLKEQIPIAFQWTLDSKSLIILFKQSICILLEGGVGIKEILSTEEEQDQYIDLATDYINKQSVLIVISLFKLHIYSENNGRWNLLKSVSVGSEFRQLRYSSESNDYIALTTENEFLCGNIQNIDIFRMINVEEEEKVEFFDVDWKHQLLLFQTGDCVKLMSITDKHVMKEITGIDAAVFHEQSLIMFKDSSKVIVVHQNAQQEFQLNQRYSTIESIQGNHNRLLFITSFSTKQPEKTAAKEWLIIIFLKFLLNLILWHWETNQAIGDEKIVRELYKLQPQQQSMENKTLKQLSIESSMDIEQLARELIKSNVGSVKLLMECIEAVDDSGWLLENINHLTNVELIIKILGKYSSSTQIVSELFIINCCQYDQLGLISDTNKYADLIVKYLPLNKPLPKSLNTFGSEEMLIERCRSIDQHCGLLDRCSELLNLISNQEFKQKFQKYSDLVYKYELIDLNFDDFLQLETRLKIFFKNHCHHDLFQLLEITENDLLHSIIKQYPLVNAQALEILRDLRENCNKIVVDQIVNHYLLKTKFTFQQQIELFQLLESMKSEYIVIQQLFEEYQVKINLSTRELTITDYTLMDKKVVSLIVQLNDESIIQQLIDAVKEIGNEWTIFLVYSLNLHQFSCNYYKTESPLRGKVIEEARTNYLHDLLKENVNNKNVSQLIKCNRNLINVDELLTLSEPRLHVFLELLQFCSDLHGLVNSCYGNPLQLLTILYYSHSNHIQVDDITKLVLHHLKSEPIDILSFACALCMYYNHTINVNQFDPDLQEIINNICTKKQLPSSLYEGKENNSIVNARISIHHLIASHAQVKRNVKIFTQNLLSVAEFESVFDLLERIDNKQLSVVDASLLLLQNK